MLGRARSGDGSRQRGGAAAGPTAWARVAVRLLAYAEERGADRERLLDASGLTEAHLRDPDGRIPLLSVYALIEAAAEALEDACLGLRFAIGLRPADLDALGFLMVTSPTFGVALSRMLHYQRVWNDGERFSLELHDGLARVRYTPHGPERPAHRQLAQLVAADLVVNGGQLAGGLEVRCVRFRHEAPSAVASESARLLGAPMEFGMPADEVWLPAAELERPLPGANEAMSAFFARHVDGQLQRLPQGASLTERVRSLLQESLLEGPPGPGTLAPRLKMSARTLQRRLQAEGTSLQAELERVREERALAALQSGVSIAEVAWMLGYSEPSAFHHAFKRWTGLSPEAWRARHRP